MRDFRRRSSVIRLCELLCIAQIFVTVWLTSDTAIAIPYADAESNVQGGFPLYDLAAFNDPNCLPKTDYVSNTVDPYPDYCQPGQKAEVTDTSDYIETRRVAPDVAGMIHTRLAVVPGGDYIVYVSGTMSYTFNHLVPFTGWVAESGQADAECTNKGVAGYSNNPVTETASGPKLWVPHRFDYVESAALHDKMDLVIRFADRTSAIDGNPSPYLVEAEDWIPTNTSVSVAGNEFFAGCSPTHEYYAYIDSDALAYPSDLQLYMDSSHFAALFSLVPEMGQADLNFILQSGHDPSCLPRSCPVHPFTAPRKIKAGSAGGAYTYRGYPCPKWTGEDWVANGAPPGTTRTMEAQVGAISTATLLVDTRKNQDEGLLGNANTGIYGSVYNTYGQTITVGLTPQFVTATRADGTRFTHFEETGTRGGMFTCNWALPGFKYRVDASGTYLYNAGRPAWLNCNYPKASVLDLGKRYCIKNSGGWSAEPNGMPKTHTDATFGSGCRIEWTNGVIEDKRDPAATFGPADTDGNYEISVPPTSTDNVFNTYLGSGSYGRRSGYSFQAPNWFSETCTDAIAWQCQAPEAREEEDEYPYPSTQCFLREPDAKGDPDAQTHRGGTVMGPSTSTVVPVKDQVINGLTQTVVDLSVTTTTKSVETAMADAECATAPWAVTNNNKDVYVTGTVDRAPSYDEPIGWTTTATPAHAVPIDPQWRFNRARGGGVGAGDEELSEDTEDPEFYGPFRPRTLPGYVEGTPTGKGWHFASYERVTGLPTWVQFTSGYHDWYDLYIDSDSLRSWGMTETGTSWQRVQRQWRPKPGTAKSLNPDHGEYGCSSTHEYHFDDFSPTGVGPLQFTISDYDLDWFNWGKFNVTVTKLGIRNDIPRYRDWCQISGSSTWSLGVVETLSDGSLSTTCDPKKFLEIEWVNADTTNASSTVDDEEFVVIRNTGDVSVDLNNLKLSTSKGSVKLVSSTALSVPARGKATVSTYLGIDSTGDTATVTITTHSNVPGPTYVVTTNVTVVNEALQETGLLYGAEDSSYLDVGDTVELWGPSGSSWILLSSFDY